jgi:hypothetical protein
VRSFANAGLESVPGIKSEGSHLVESNEEITPGRFRRGLADHVSKLSVRKNCKISDRIRFTG